jgi:hypothetical protein
MVPAPFARPATSPIARVETAGSGTRWWPANVPGTVRTELRALAVWGVLLGVLGVSLLLGYVWVRIKVVDAGYRLSVTRQLVERLEQEGRELAVRAAAADGQLEERAAQRLGMRRPGREEEELLP